MDLTLLLLIKLQPEGLFEQMMAGVLLHLQ
ncbi:hypothetical protein LINPERHAP2_LOCUS13513 [Linum perenne]